MQDGIKDASVKRNRKKKYGRFFYIFRLFFVDLGLLERILAQLFSFDLNRACRRMVAEEERRAPDRPPEATAQQMTVYFKLRMIGWHTKPP
jgi:hypothetical protein